MSGQNCKAPIGALARALIARPLPCRAPSALRAAWWGSTHHSGRMQGYPLPKGQLQERNSSSSSERAHAHGACERGRTKWPGTHPKQPLTICWDHATLRKTPANLKHLGTGQWCKFRPQHTTVNRWQHSCQRHAASLPDSHVKFAGMPRLCKKVSKPGSAARQEKGKSCMVGMQSYT